MLAKSAGILLLFITLFVGAAQEADPRLMRTIEMPNTLTSITPYGPNFIVAADEAGAVWRVSSIENELIKKLALASTVINVGKYPNDRLVRLYGECLEELSYDSEKKSWNDDNELSGDCGSYTCIAATANPNKIVALESECLRVFDVQTEAESKEKITRMDQLREQGLLAPLPEHAYVKQIRGILRMALGKPHESPRLWADFDDLLTVRALQTTCKLPNGLWVVGRGKTIQIFDTTKKMPKAVRNKLLSRTKTPDPSRMERQRQLNVYLEESLVRIAASQTAEKSGEKKVTESDKSTERQKKPKIDWGAAQVRVEQLSQKMDCAGQ